MTNEEIKTLYEGGLTIREIAEKANFSYEKIRKILKAMKVKWSRNYISDLTPDQVKTILEKFDNGTNINELSKWYELSPPAISRLLKANNRKIISVRKKYEILRQTPINSIQKQIIVGGLLGDGGLYKHNENGNYFYSFGHCEEQAQYFHWTIAMLDPFINGYNKNVDKRGNSMLQTHSICHQGLNYLGDMFYVNKVKIIPDNLDMYLTPLALAIWIMDDGNLNMGVNMRISSQGFTETENYKLRDYLKRCFGLNSKVMVYKYKNNEKKYYMLTLNKENTQKLSNIIRPYVVDCMKYKLMPESSTT